jgi:hypothetical protein
MPKSKFVQFSLIDGFKNTKSSRNMPYLIVTRLQKSPASTLYQEPQFRFDSSLAFVGTGAAEVAVLGASGGSAGGVTYASPGFDTHIDVSFIL